MGTIIRLDRGRLTALAAGVLSSTGVPENDAEFAADCFVAADADGLPSHGLARFGAYVGALERGFIVAAPDISCETSGAVNIIDGGNGLGPVVALAATRAAIASAKTNGVGVAFARRSNHFGMASTFAEMISEQSMIGLVMSNASATMAVWGGSTPMLGTNPLAAAFPGAAQPPFLLDMASAVVARGKIRIAMDRDEPIGEGWAIRPDGQPAATAKEAMDGALLPFGKAKGSGIALLIELLCGVTSGARAAPDVQTMYEARDGHAGVGHFLLALDPSRVQPLEAFTARYDRLIETIRAGDPAAGFSSVSLPGERRGERRRNAEHLGIPLAATTARELAALAAQVGSDPRHVAWLQGEVQLDAS